MNIDFNLGMFFALKIKRIINHYYNDYLPKLMERDEKGYLMKFKFLNTWSKFMTIVVVLLTASATAHAGLIYQFTFTHTSNGVQGTTSGKIYGLEDNTTGEATDIKLESVDSNWILNSVTDLSLWNGFKLSEYTMLNGVLTRFGMTYWNDSTIDGFGGGIYQRYSLIMDYNVEDSTNAYGSHQFRYVDSTTNFQKATSGLLTLSAYAPLETEVPEPSTLAIFALGMIGLASRRFKKQS
jgi:hypothetical protein